MKFALFFALIPVLFFFGGTFALAEDWTTTDGKTYQNVTVVKAEPDAVTILHHDGGALVPLTKLSPDLQKRFAYDPDKAQAAAEARNRMEADSARAFREEARQLAERQAAEAATVQDAPTAPAQTDAAAQPTTAGSKHHSMSELVDTSHRLRDDASYDNHYSMSSVATHGPILIPPPDASHHSMGSLFGSGDPLGR